MILAPSGQDFNEASGAYGKFRTNRGELIQLFNQASQNHRQLATRLAVIAVGVA